MFAKYMALMMALMIPALAQAATTTGTETGAYRHTNTTTSQQNATFPGNDATSWGNDATLGHSAPTGTQQAAVSSPGDDYTPLSARMQEEKMLNLLNQDRKNHGLPPLAPDEALSAIARAKSQDMRDKGYFSHTSPTWGSPRDMLRHFGYEFRGASENIAHHANVDKAQAAFMTSDGHRRNILGQYWEKVGIGIVYDAQGFIYATQLFAR